jgi:hypothetical protein
MLAGVSMLFGEGDEEEGRGEWRRFIRADKAIKDKWITN